MYLGTWAELGTDRALFWHETTTHCIFEISKDQYDRPAEQVEDPTPAQVAIDALKGEFSSASLRIATSVRELCAEGNNKKLKDKLEDVKEETSLRWILHAISPTALQGKGQFAKARHMDKAGHVGKVS